MSSLCADVEIPPLSLTSPFWLAERPLILASGSAARRSLLEAAAVPHRIVPATIDERAVEQPLRESGASPATIAAHLAVAKALAVSAANPDDLVLAADQTLALGTTMFTKAQDIAHARLTLQALAGRTHSLHSAWALARDGQVLHPGATEARLSKRYQSTAFLDAYEAEEAVELCASVGAYRIEAAGLHLFASVEGDHATIMGLPLLPVLSALRQRGYLLS